MSTSTHVQYNLYIIYKVWKSLLFVLYKFYVVCIIKFQKVIWNSKKKYENMLL